jgi:hypothetical protein
MKCYHVNCRQPERADFVKLGTALESCARDLPDQEGMRALIEGDADRCGDWTHVDCTDKCCACGTYELDGSMSKCSSCEATACDDCLPQSVCVGCVEEAEYRKDQEHSWSHR